MSTIEEDDSSSVMTDQSILPIDCLYLSIEDCGIGWTYLISLEISFTDSRLFRGTARTPLWSSTGIGFIVIYIKLLIVIVIYIKLLNFL